MCMEVIDMGVRTNIVLDDQLVNEVKQLTALTTGCLCSRCKKATCRNCFGDLLNNPVF